MRYATFSHSSDATPRLGLVRGDRIIDASTLGVPGTASLLELILAGPDAWRRVADAAAGNAAQKAKSFSATEIRWHAPIPRPLKNVFCVGRNYAEHVKEGAAAFAARRQDRRSIPVFFTKAPTTRERSVRRHAAGMARRTQQVDWEAELGVIIGARRPGHSLAMR